MSSHFLLLCSWCSPDFCSFSMSTPPSYLLAFQAPHSLSLQLLDTGECFPFFLFRCLIECMGYLIKERCQSWSHICPFVSEPLHTTDDAFAFCCCLLCQFLVNVLQSPGPVPSCSHWIHKFILCFFLQRLPLGFIRLLLQMDAAICSQFCDNSV